MITKYLRAFKKLNYNIFIEYNIKILKMNQINLVKPKSINFSELVKNIIKIIKCNIGEIIKLLNKIIDLLKMNL